MNNYQLLVWFGRMLNNPNVPESQKEVARKGIAEILDVRDEADRNWQISSINTVLDILNDR